MPKDPADDSDWDVDGSPPDVVVELRCPMPAGSPPLITRTEEVQSFTPQWSTGECDTLADAIIAQPIEVKVIDIDSFFDDEIGTSSYALTAADFEKGQAEIVIPGYVNSLILKLSAYYQP